MAKLDNDGTRRFVAGGGQREAGPTGQYNSMLELGVDAKRMEFHKTSRPHCDELSMPLPKLSQIKW